MKRKTVSIMFWCMIFFMSQTIQAQNTRQDTSKCVIIVGTFTGIKITAGNFYSQEVYKINEYYILPESLTEKQIDSLKGKKVRVTGKLKIVEGEIFPAKTSNTGRIYEPYKEPEKKIIINPTFTVISNNP